MPVAVLAGKKHDGPSSSDLLLPEAVMHNDVCPTHKQNICQAWSRHVYRIKTGARQHPLKWSETVLPRNLCKRQNQNVALQWRVTRSGQSDLQPSPSLQLAEGRAKHPRMPWLNRIVLVAGNHVTGSRHRDIFHTMRGEAAVCVCLHACVRHATWIMVRISRFGVRHCNSRRTTTADTVHR
jgi:hypothetical protein